MVDYDGKEYRLRREKLLEYKINSDKVRGIMEEISSIQKSKNLGVLEVISTLDRDLTPLKNDLENWIGVWQQMIDEETIAEKKDSLVRERRDYQTILNAVLENPYQS